MRSRLYDIMVKYGVHHGTSTFWFNHSQGQVTASRYDYWTLRFTVTYLSQMNDTVLVNSSLALQFSQVSSKLDKLQTQCTMCFCLATIYTHLATFLSLFYNVVGNLEKNTNRLFFIYIHSLI